MKDEEMAEEYTAKNGFGSDCNNLTSYDANKEIEQAFLAGLKEGRPQWHKVADGDLPKKKQRICCKGKRIRRHICLYWQILEKRKIVYRFLSERIRCYCLV